MFKICKLLSITILASFISTAVYAQNTWNSAQSYELFNNALQKYVNDQGLVNYQGVKSDSKDFVRFIYDLEDADISKLEGDDLKTFWINAYNAITLKVVSGAYPVKGIRRINFGFVWEKSRKVAKIKKSLGDIEHKILRPLGDPRIHFAINCASIGCPKLPNEVFVAEKLEEQLERETKRFINDSTKVRLDKAEKILYHSAIFKWFEEDFVKTHGSIQNYIASYINEEDKKYLQNYEVKLKSLKYDWGLNKQ